MARTNSDQLISRLEAKTLGRKYYFTGKPCPKGHIDQRRVSNWNCIKCELEKNRERGRYMLDWQRSNRDKIAKNTAKWRDENRERHRAYNRRWINENPDKANAATASRRARIREATPPWADIPAIKAFYRHAARLTRQRGTPYEVDHIIPLAGKMISGLHVHNNLRVVPKAVNRSKGNRWHAPR